jgi:hypothetical protein
MTVPMCTPQSAIDERTISDLMLSAGTPEAMAVYRNPVYIKAIVKQAKYAYDLLKAGDGAGVAVAMISSADSAFSAGVKSGGSSKIGKAAAFGVGQFALSIGLLKLGANASPGKAVATIGLMFAQKVVLVGGLAAESDRAKCYNAIASTVVSVGVTAVSAPTGIGAVLGVLSIVASGYEAYSVCRK